MYNILYTINSKIMFLLDYLYHSSKLHQVTLSFILKGTALFSTIKNTNIFLFTRKGVIQESYLPKMFWNFIKESMKQNVRNFENYVVNARDFLYATSFYYFHFMKKALYKKKRLKV